ncbi:hypothetical protein CC2G_011190 [Coprinopsis cinerea AmutBmut pab1-1]|nr:hypothetical protein CC2G_011190 [Coprinopsis cinerea AmutBmut pab1-1]
MLLSIPTSTPTRRHDVLGVQAWLFAGGRRDLGQIKTKFRSHCVNPCTKAGLLLAETFAMDGSNMTASTAFQFTAAQLRQGGRSSSRLNEASRTMHRITAMFRPSVFAYSMPLRE